MASHLGSGLLNLNLSYLTDDKDLNLIGIYSKNRYEFNISDLACSLYGLTSVPLYETLGVENLVFCLDQTKMTTVICSG
jgi:long-chain acyl-CoA synthetase